MAGSKSRPCAEIARPAADQVRRTIAEFLSARQIYGTRLCVGLSGGRDSLVLLHALACLRSSPVAFDLSAVHVHHGLSAGADGWAAFCSEFCERSRVPLDVVHVEVPRASKEGLESAARRLRHAVFAGYSADWLALAHHRDDQAETVLFRLLRGAGVKGAAGMPAERPQARGPRLIRPLLEVPATLIARYAEECSLQWVEDESNSDARYRRNHIRHVLMPCITKRFPGGTAVLARAGRHFAEAAQLLEDLAQIDREAVAAASGRIELARFHGLSLPRARNLLRLELLSAGLRAPDARWLDEALRQLATTGAASETCLTTADGELHVYRGQLHVLRQRPAVPAGAVPWSGEDELTWGIDRVSFRSTVGEGISRRLLRSAPVVLRCRQGGEQLQPDSRRPLRTLRNLLQEAAIPPWERGRLPLLWCGERLVWVAGIGVDAAFVCAPGEPGVLPVRQLTDPPSAVR